MRTRARKAQDLPEEEADPARHGLATYLAFGMVGAIPLVPYVILGLEHRFPVSAVTALAAQFDVGASRSLVTASRRWVSGLETLILRALVAIAAYATGAGIARVIRSAV